MKDKLLKQAEREYNPKQRVVALLVEGVFFLGVLPIVIVRLSSTLDWWFHLPSFADGSINTVVGGVLMIGGFLFALWAIYVQFTIGKGTPVPLMATQKLIIQKPYNYCRNPMTLGTIVLYLGFAILLGSLSAVGLVLLGTTFLLVYIKFIEEKEMEWRFGKEYREYRRQTPFLIPRLWHRGG